MAKDPAFSFYAQDFLVDTVQWSRAAKGLHCELLAIAWINGFLEANHGGEPVELNEEGLSLWRERVGRKWYLLDGRLFNDKLEQIREKRQNFKDNQSVKGKLSAEKRKQTINQDSTTVEPVSPVQPLEREYEKEHEDPVLEKKNEPKDLNIPFDEFWDLYDKKVGSKDKLVKKWAALTNDAREKIMLYIPEYKRAKPDKQYRKDPSTFLNNQSWNDELIFSHGTPRQGSNPAGKLGTSEARIATAKKW